MVFLKRHDKLFNQKEPMNHYTSDIAFSPTVKALQTKYGSRASYEKKAKANDWDVSVTPALSEFLENSDMFYLGTANLDGQPYIQYRGGPTGFLKVIDDKTLGFADFAGNRQFISTGNLVDNSKAFIFLMDYETRRRIKIWGIAKIVDDDPQLLRRLSGRDYPGKVECAVLFKIETWCRNCPSHIHQRIPYGKVEKQIAELQTRIKFLEAKLTAKK